MAGRVIETKMLEEDIKLEGSLRPQTLQDYIGQQKAKEILSIYIEAARQRNDALDHVLFYGPPGLGKTTLAGIIANEMNVNLKVTSGPAIEKPGEMAAILNNLHSDFESKVADSRNSNDYDAVFSQIAEEEDMYNQLHSISF